MKRVNQESELVVGRRYEMGVNHSSIYAYTGKVELESKTYHEFLFLPTFMEIPPKEPTHFQTKLLPEGEVIFWAEHPYLKKLRLNKAVILH